MEAARAAAAAAADVHRAGANERGAISWSEKGRSDFVTEVDLAAEREIVSHLRQRFPEHEIVAEEGTVSEEGAGSTPDAPADGANPSAGLNAPPSAGIRWIVDPLDGTTNWLHGYPEHAVSIAAEDGAGVRVALVLNTATGERFEAIRGKGSRLDDTPIHVSDRGELRLALVGTGFPFKKIELLPAYLQVFERVLRATAGVRRSGSAALDLCHVACGRLDAFWEYWLMPWDVAAGALIVREAGGTFLATTPPSGGEEASERCVAPGLSTELRRGGGCLAVGPGLQEEFLALLACGPETAPR